MIALGVSLQATGGLGGQGAPSTLLQIATNRNNGIAPIHFFDFANNRALFSSVDVGTIASIPNLTGTLNLVAGVGQRLAGAANILLITSPGITYPFTLMAKFTRTTDTGAAENILYASQGGNGQNQSSTNVGVADTARATMTTANVAQGTTTIATVTTTGVPYKLAGRFGTNDIYAALNGVLAPTPDVVATAPPTPDALSIGGTILNTLFLIGDIEYVSIFSSALTDAQLQAVTT